MSLNPELIQKRCEEIAESLARLEKFKDIDKETILDRTDMLEQTCHIEKGLVN